MKPSRSTPKPRVRLSAIIARLPAIVTVERAVCVVNTCCGVASDEIGPDVPRRTYSWSEIYDELRGQGFVSVAIRRELIPGALWSAHLIPAFHNSTRDEEGA